MVRHQRDLQLRAGSVRRTPGQREQAFVRFFRLARCRRLGPSLVDGIGELFTCEPVAKEGHRRLSMVGPRASGPCKSRTK